MNTDISLTGGFEGFPRLLKPVEVASLLGISKSFAYRLLQTGEIPTVRLGKACRVRPQDLEAYIEQNIHNQADDR
jgi:excisionase family DNA binding protein